MTQESNNQPPWLKGPFPYQDPTKLTVEAIDKLAEQVGVRMSSLQELLESKLDHIRLAHEQKFESIKTQFSSNEAALHNAFKSNKDLIDAQNKANTDAAQKAEEAFKEQITSLTTFMNATFAGIDKNLDDLKSGASADKGATAAQARMMAAVALAVTILGFFFVIATHDWGENHTYPPPPAPPSTTLQVVPK